MISTFSLLIFIRNLVVLLPNFMALERPLLFLWNVHNGSSPFWNSPSSGLLLFFHLDFFLWLCWLGAARFASYSCRFYSRWGFVLEEGLVGLVGWVHGALTTRPLQNSPLAHRSLLAGVEKLPVSAIVCKWFSKLPGNTCLLVLEIAASISCPIAFLCFLQHSVDTIQVLEYWWITPPTHT